MKINIFIWYFFIIVIFIIFYIPLSQATPFFEVKEKYLDYHGVQHDFNNQNLAQYPLYLVSENSNNYTITRFGESVYLPKRTWIQYDFYPDRIVPKYIISNYAQINGLVTKVNASVWYLTIPFSASKYKSITDELIDMGVFKRTNKITVTDSNSSGCLNCSYQVVPKVIGNDIRLYFNPQKFNRIVYPLTLTENTIFVDNATTAGFTTSNISTNGYWSAFGGGSIGTPLNETIHQNLTGYWDFESTSGTTEYGINKFGRFPNSSIQPIYYGNKTLSYTNGDMWGSAISLDGVDDYFNLPSIVGLSKKGVIHTVVKQRGTSGYIWADYEDGNNENRLYYNSTDLLFVGYDNSAYQYILTSPYTSDYTKITGIFDFNYAELYINSASVGTDTSVDMGDYLHNVYLGVYPEVVDSSLNGYIDELYLSTSSVLVSSTYSPYWELNTTANSSNGYNITAVKFNISNLNVQGNYANISMRQNGTINYTQISTNYISDTWINQIMFPSTDFKIEVYGNGSSRAFIISGEISEGLPENNKYDIFISKNNNVYRLNNNSIIYKIYLNKNVTTKLYNDSSNLIYGSYNKLYISDKRNGRILYKKFLIDNIKNISIQENILVNTNKFLYIFDKTNYSLLYKHSINNINEVGYE